ncbi:Oxidoreductase, molybdopterin-binding domain-containing protein [Dissophora ornata]|nr:Oxidoreductase, molybdopterin-binding domain-containing protein [Dissophora ornata]
MDFVFRVRVFGPVLSHKSCLPFSFSSIFTTTSHPLPWILPQATNFHLSALNTVRSKHAIVMNPEPYHDPPPQGKTDVEHLDSSHGHSSIHPPLQHMVDEKHLDYSHDPSWQQSNFLVHCDKPFNAEPFLPTLVNAEITPTEFFFKRNHGPIPNLSLDHHQVYVGIQLNDVQHEHDSSAPGIAWKALSMHDIMTKWPKVTVSATLQCAGNRRDGLAAVKEVDGVIWKSGAVSTAVWSGPRLCDILKDIADIPKEEYHRVLRDFHVSFEADGHVHEDICYGSSIPFRKAMDPLGDVILAYEMNGEPLTREHGFPLRAIVPGFIGARSVKFLQRIIIQPRESNSFFQKRDYKILDPTIDHHNAEQAWDLAASLGEMNVQCVICSPTDQEAISLSEPVTIRGYAISGGGRGIYRVEVSADGGQTWEPADKMEQTPDEYSGMFWTWALWEKTVPMIAGSTEIIARAYDSSGNTQPEHTIWNYRGVMNNAWSRASVTQDPANHM